MLWSFSRSLSEVLGVRSPQSTVPEKNGASEVLAFVSAYSDVCFPLYITLILIFLFFCYMCGLPGHTYDDSGLILKARV